jgi:hypothetical protein
LAADWVGKGGRARMLRDAEVTATRQRVGAVVCVKAVGMKEAWHLAASDGALSAPQIITLYSKRWTIEPSFRDSKDLRFGMGMSVLRIDNPQRRDRLLLLNAFAILLLTILGAAGESLGMDRQLRTSTAKRRVHSLFQQGCLLYDLIPNMPDKRLRPLIERYQELLSQIEPSLRPSASPENEGIHEQRALITGITGMVGSHLLDYLLEQTDWEIHGMLRWRSPLDNISGHLDDINAGGRIKLHYADLRDTMAIQNCVQAARPDYVFHLAAQSYPQTSFTAPLDTMDTNIQGTERLLGALRRFAPEAIIHVCASSEVFGRVPPRRRAQGNGHGHRRGLSVSLARSAAEGRHDLSGAPSSRPGRLCQRQARDALHARGL